MTKRALLLMIIGLVLFSIMMVTLIYGEEGRKSLVYSVPFFLILTVFSFIFGLKALNQESNFLDRTSAKKEERKIGYCIIASFIISTTILIITLLILLFTNNMSGFDYLIEKSLIFQIIGTVILFPITNKHLK